MRPIPEAADVTAADRLRCRTLIEATSFYAVDHEDAGACWERVLPSGDCLVLAVCAAACMHDCDVEFIHRQFLDLAARAR